jgi:hypothetical protein
MRCDKRRQLDTKSYSCSQYRSGEISQRSSTPQVASEERATKASHRTSQLTSHYRSVVVYYSDVDEKQHYTSNGLPRVHPEDASFVFGHRPHCPMLASHSVTRHSVLFPSQVSIYR